MGKLLGNVIMAIIVAVIVQYEQYGMATFIALLWLTWEESK